MHEHSRPAFRTALTVLVVVLAGTACQARSTPPSNDAAEKSPQESSVMEPTATPGTTRVDCGEPFALPPANVLALTGRFPTEVAAGEQTVSGTVEVVSSEELRGVAPPGADVFLVRDGRVVTTPLPQDAVGILWAVAAGETKSVPAEAGLASCDSGASLEPGSYELYARLMVIPEDGGGVESFGGPWPLQVR